MTLSPLSNSIPSLSFFSDEVREGFFVSSMMKRYWAAQIKVLGEVDRVCRKHGIKWFADCGTLLGAVRHGGYIPWDDDLDICMLREDWIRFFEVAGAELPEGYCLMTQQLEEDHDDALGRVVNAHAIDFTDAHMKEFFGCPYTVGIDIFPLDGLSPDKEAEEERCRKARNVHKACEMVTAGGLETPECRHLLATIESENHMTLHRRGNLLRELRLLLERLYSMYPAETAQDVALMHYWVLNGHHRYSRELFRDTVWIPFEYTSVQVPARYDEVLEIEYRNFMAVFKGGGVHEYPVFHDQEDILRGHQKENPFRYTLTRATAEAFRRPKTLQGRCGELTATMNQAHGQVQALVQKGDINLAGQVLDGCQKLAISLGTLMEQQMPGSEDMVRQLEEYCELVYQVSGQWNDSSADELSAAVREVEASVAAYFTKKKKQVLFLAFKGDWWSAMEPVYRKMAALPDAEVCVMSVSYQTGDRLTGIDGGAHNDGEKLPAGLPLVSAEDYDIARNHPDVIVTQYPYDGSDSCMDVPRFFYSENLLAHTDQLVYVPCFDADDPIDEKDKAVAALRVLIEQPAVLYADRVVVKTPAMQDLYRRILTEIAGAKDLWQEKVLDFLEYFDEFSGSQQEPIAIPDVAEPSLASLPDSWQQQLAGRKIMLYRINAPFLMQNRGKALDKLKSSMDLIRESADRLVCVYSPEADVREVERMDPELWKEYRDFVDSILADENVIYDEEGNSDRCVDLVAGYYGTPGHLAHLCRNHKKPVMLMNVEC